MISEIHEAEIFRVLSPQSIAHLASQLRPYAFEPRRVLYFAGDDAPRLWVVRKGQVRLYNASARGQIMTLDVLGPGEVFGALTTLDRETYPSSAEAVTAGDAWWLPRQVFLDLVASEPSVAVEILRIISRRLVAAHDRLRALAHDPAKSRLAAAPLDATSGGEAIVTRRALAESAGTTVETAIRVLRRFEREDLIRGSVGRIAILDDATLSRIASGEAVGIPEKA